MDDRTADKPRPTSEVIANITDEIVAQLNTKIPAPNTSRAAWAMDRKRIVEEGDSDHPRRERLVELVAQVQNLRQPVRRLFDPSDHRAEALL